MKTDTELDAHSRNGTPDSIRDKGGNDPTGEANLVDANEVPTLEDKGGRRKAEADFHDDHVRDEINSRYDDDSPPDDDKGRKGRHKGFSEAYDDDGGKHPHPNDAHRKKTVRKDVKLEGDDAAEPDSDFTSSKARHKAIKMVGDYYDHDMMKKFALIDHVTKAIEASATKAGASGETSAQAALDDFLKNEKLKDYSDGHTGPIGVTKRDGFIRDSLRAMDAGRHITGGGTSGTPIKFSGHGRGK
jgi:hypothetical protein